MAQSDTSTGEGGVPLAPGIAPEDFDVSQRSDVAKLRKHAVGLGGVLFLTVTGSAPISAMLFNTPIMVGYVAMARKKTAAGGFYSYISHGLGRELGIGTGFGSLLAYSVFEASLCGGFAYFLGLKLNSYGVNIAWPWLALGMVALISVLTFFDIRLSSSLLAVGLISEVVILIIFDIFLFARGNVNFAAINPANAFKTFTPTGGLVAGAIGVGLFFAFWSWVGFEMAPNYGEESRA